LTARRTGRAGAKAGLSDPAVPNGRAVAYRIKATLGITGLSPPRVHIDGEVWHLNIRGDMVETPWQIQVPAITVNSDRLRTRDEDNTVGSLATTRVAVMTP
jgi:hypothetical protein